MNPPSSDAVVVNVPLRAEYASAIRVLVSSLAADLDFTVDELDDLRLGVSELFTLFADDAAPDARCTADIVALDGQVSVSMSRDVGEPVELDGLASTILLAVVDSHDVDGVGGVTIRKRAVEAGG